MAGHQRLALDGLTVIAFESRRAVELERLLVRHGAAVLQAPALREVPIGKSPEVERFVEDLEKGRIHALILLTGVGTRALVEAAAPRFPRDRLIDALRAIPLVARGPKPVAALRELGLAPTHLVPEPNTWRELLQTVDRELPVRGRCVAVQEYGKPNLELLAGLEQRGAQVLRVPVYRWALPEDLAPLRNGIAALRTGRVDIAVFTTAVQIAHVLEVAGPLADEVVRALDSRAVVASIGPTASEALKERGIRVEIQPEHPKLGPLVAAIAADGRGLAERKRMAFSSELLG